MCGESAIEPSALVGPYDDPTPRTMREGIGVDDGICPDIGQIGVVDGVVVPVIITTDQHRPAARISGGIDDGSIEECDVITQDMDRAADSPGLDVRDIHGARQSCRAVPACIDEYRSAHIVN